MCWVPTRKRAVRPVFAATSAGRTSTTCACTCELSNAGASGITGACGYADTTFASVSALEMGMISAMPPGGSGSPTGTLGSYAGGAFPSAAYTRPGTPANCGSSRTLYPCLAAVGSRGP